MARISKIINEKISFPDINTWVDFGTGNGTVVKELLWDKMATKKIAIEKFPQNIGNGWEIIDNLDNLLINNEKYDLFSAFDCIEHLVKEDGFKLLEKIEDNFKHKLIFTPRGFLKQDETTHPDLIKLNPWQRHLSGWDVDDFKKMGYNVIILTDFHNPAGHTKLFDAIIAYK